MTQATKQDIPEIAARALAGFLDAPGAILYSSHSTIRKGNVYLMGLNPGGSGGTPLQESVDTLLSKEFNSYTDEAWENEAGAYEPGKAPLQRRVQWLLESLDQTPKDVISTNLIFMQSRDARGVSIELANKCWPVHEALLSIVKPSLILTFGNSGFSPYGFIRAKFGGEEHYAPSGHGSWALKGFKSYMAGSEVFVVGVPHLSRYCPIGKPHVVQWIKSRESA